MKVSELQVEDRGKVSFNIEGGTQDYQIAPLLLMVFVENAFKHSTASQSKDISVEVNLTVDDWGKLEFQCINSFEEHTNIEKLSTGIGLENVKKRLQLIYLDAHQLSIKSENKYYEVHLSLQLKQVQ